MNQLVQDILWRANHMEMQHWCVVSLALTLLCYFVLNWFSNGLRR